MFGGLWDSKNKQFHDTKTSRSPTQSSKIQTNPVKGVESSDNVLNSSPLAEGKQEVKSSLLAAGYQEKQWIQTVP